MELRHKTISIIGNLIKRGVNINPICPLCLDSIKSIEYTFIKCHMLKKEWDVENKHEWLPIDVSLYEFSLPKYRKTLVTQKCSKKYLFFYEASRNPGLQWCLIMKYLII